MRWFSDNPHLHFLGVWSSWQGEKKSSRVMPEIEHGLLSHQNDTLPKNPWDVGRGVKLPLFWGTRGPSRLGVWCETIGGVRSQDGFIGLQSINKNTKHKNLRVFPFQSDDFEVPAVNLPGVPHIFQWSLSYLWTKPPFCSIYLKYPWSKSYPIPYIPICSMISMYIPYALCKEHIIQTYIYIYICHKFKLFM